MAAAETRAERGAAAMKREVHGTLKVEQGTGAKRHLNPELIVVDPPRHDHRIEGATR